MNVARDVSKSNQTGQSHRVGMMMTMKIDIKVTMVRRAQWSRIRSRTQKSRKKIRATALQTALDKRVCVCV